ncbi:hypothetical protein COCCU_14115 (plasmid) [Corynebacterium occultum]|uniref:Uncharacterized protein n=1 Tax=Corynebacterium occultum TaxID=2675219 RepID=A0A6B8VX40_9CORY|nr:hypothetical protein COCCU_14115 [Corynebacterium occultum]
MRTATSRHRLWCTQTASAFLPRLRHGGVRLAQRGHHRHDPTACRTWVQPQPAHGLRLRCLPRIKQPPGHDLSTAGGRVDASLVPGRSCAGTRVSEGCFFGGELCNICLVGDQEAHEVFTGDDVAVVIPLIKGAGGRLLTTMAPTAFEHLLRGHQKTAAHRTHGLLHKKTSNSPPRPTGVPR